MPKEAENAQSRVISVLPTKQTGESLSQIETRWKQEHAAVGARTYTDYMRDLFPDYKRGRSAPRKPQAGSLRKAG